MLDTVRAAPNTASFMVPGEGHAQRVCRCKFGRSGLQLQRPASRLEGYRSHGVPISVLDAVKMGIWDYEPPRIDDRSFSETRAMPGSNEKLAILAERLRSGLPLWHPNDSRTYADSTGQSAD
jgi:hypothetical protein